MSDVLGIDEFLGAPGVTFDVRSPGEYDKGHIPGAVNLPLFTDNERAHVGTVYKQQGREEAIDLGLEYVGPKLAGFVKQAKEYSRVAKVYCWRGGMRSASMAWLLETADFSCVLLERGYKSFRHWVLKAFERKLNICVLGGFTGSGKTEVLRCIAGGGGQIVDLEAIANHRGSSYGMIGQPLQPTVEHFENEIATRWMKYSDDQSVWIEDESRCIGRCKIPDALFRQMREAPLLFMDRPYNERVDILYCDYHALDREELIAATKRLEKHLGG